MEIAVASRCAARHVVKAASGARYPHTCCLQTARHAVFFSFSLSAQAHSLSDTLGITFGGASASRLQNSYPYIPGASRERYSTTKARRILRGGGVQAQLTFNLPTWSAAIVTLPKVG